MQVLLKGNFISCLGNSRRLLAVIGVENGPSYRGWVLYTSEASTGVDNGTMTSQPVWSTAFNF